MFIILLVWVFTHYKNKNMNHKKLVIMWIWIGLIVSVGVLWWELPLQQVSHPECKWVHRQELSDECKIVLDIPREQSMSELLISVLWWSSYTDNHVPWSWSHPSTDFVSTIGTPVYAIGEGEVITARYRAWYGNAITIRHKFDGDVIYSNYSHLSVMNVRPGQRVESWIKIGEVWRSGFTMGPYWYHLDFQITTAQSPSHPYWFHDCKEWWYLDVVNTWLCKEKLEAYTIDPLEFFAKYAWSDLRPVWRKNIRDNDESNDAVIAWVPNNQVEEIIQEHQVPSNKRSNDSLVEEVSPVSSIKDTVVIRRPKAQETETPQQIVKEHAAAYTDRKNQWTVWLVPWFDIDRELLGGDPEVWTIVPIQFTITQDGEPVSWKLSNRIRISWTEDITLLPWSFGRIYKWKKTVFARVQSPWVHRLDVHSGQTQLWQIVITTE